MNLASILTFLGYYKEKGWVNAKALDFRSSIRFELRRNIRDNKDLRVRVIFDDEIIDLSFCTKDM